MRTWLILAFVILAGLLTPDTAHAANFTVDKCAPGYSDWDFTVKIVKCIENSTKTAVNSMMSKLSSYMAPVVGALMVLAVALLGMRMLGGDENIRSKAFGFAIRAMLVLFFANNLGGYSSAIFDIEDQLVNLVSGGPPWKKIDEVLGMLLGVGPPPLNISKGVLGIIGASLLSSTPLGIMAFIALSAVINMLLFIYRIVFTYVIALIMIGFMIVISPLIIPMALFAAHGERFFTKWLDILLSAMITPVLLFAFLSVFMSGFKMGAEDILKLLQCGTTSGCTISPAELNFVAFQKANLPPGYSWQVPTDPSHASDLRFKSGHSTVGTPAVQSTIIPNQRRASEAVPTTLPAIDFGPEMARVAQELIYTFLALWVFASFMKSLVERVPDLATSIAEAASYISMSPSSGELKLESGLRKVQTAVTGRK